MSEPRPRLPWVNITLTIALSVYGYLTHGLSGALTFGLIVPIIWIVVVGILVWRKWPRQ